MNGFRTSLRVAVAALARAVIARPLATAPPFRYVLSSGPFALPANGKSVDWMMTLARRRVDSSLAVLLAQYLAWFVMPISSDCRRPSPASTLGLQRAALLSRERRLTEWSGCPHSEWFAHTRKAMEVPL
jgi:hypothetical protein